MKRTNRGTGRNTRTCGGIGGWGGGEGTHTRMNKWGAKHTNGRTDPQTHSCT